MDIQLFRTFLLVSKLLNITHAAEQLNFTQPAVTAQIRTLEGHFNVPLFERLGKKLRITTAGQELALQTEKMLAIYSEMHASSQVLSEKNEPIKLGSATSMASYVLPPILREFQSRGVKSIVLIDIFTFLADTVKALLNNAFDLALVHDVVNHNQIMQFDILQERLVWVVQRDLVLKNDTCLDIRRYPFISCRPGSVYRSKYDPILKDKNIVPSIEYNEAAAITGAVLDGLGVSVLPYCSVAPFLTDGKLIEITTLPPLTFTLSVALRKNTVLSPATRVLLSIFAERSSVNTDLAEYLGSTY